MRKLSTGMSCVPPMTEGLPGYQIDPSPLLPNSYWLVHASPCVAMAYVVS